MLRILIIVSALCVLLLIGYITMSNKSSVVKEKAESAGIDNSKPMENIKGTSDISSKIDAAVEKSKDVISSVSEEAKTKLQAVKAQPETVKPVENSGKDSDIETDFKPSKGKNTEKAPDDKSKKNWGLLEEAQQVLIDAGEILNKAEGRTK